MGSRAPAAARDQSQRASRLASEFSATLLHNLVYDRVGEDAQLARLLDAATAVDHAHRRREEDIADAASVEQLSKAEGRVLHVARQRSIEVVAEVCATVITDGDDWVEAGHYEAQAVGEATAEARAWLRSHTNPAARADVLDVLTDEADAGDGGSEGECGDAEVVAE